MSANRWRLAAAPCCALRVDQPGVWQSSQCCCRMGESLNSTPWLACLFIYQSARGERPPPLREQLPGPRSAVYARRPSLLMQCPGCPLPLWQEEIVAHRSGGAARPPRGCPLRDAPPLPTFPRSTRFIPINGVNERPCQYPLSGKARVHPKQQEEEADDGA